MFLSSSGDLKISSALLMGRSHQLTSFLVASCSTYIVLVLNIYKIYSTALFLKKENITVVPRSHSQSLQGCFQLYMCRTRSHLSLHPVQHFYTTSFKMESVFPKFITDLNFEAVRVARVGVCLDYHFFTACIIFYICKILQLVSYGIL